MPCVFFVCFFVNDHSNAYNFSYTEECPASTYSTFSSPSLCSKLDEHKFKGVKYLSWIAIYVLVLFALVLLGVSTHEINLTNSDTVRAGVYCSQAKCLHVGSVCQPRAAVIQLNVLWRGWLGHEGATAQG